MPEPVEKKARTERTTSEETVMSYTSSDIGEEDDPGDEDSWGMEDDPGDWDDVDEDSCDTEIDEGSMGANLVSNPLSRIPQQKNTNSVDNPQLYHMQVEMDRLRAAMNLARLCTKPDIKSLCTSDDSSSETVDSRSFHMKLIQLFGPLEIKPPIKAPSIIIRQSGTTTRYVREFRRDERDDCYVFRKYPTLETESHFCVDLPLNPPNWVAGCSVSPGHRATLTEGNEVAILPDLLEQINNRDDPEMVLLCTQKAQNKEVVGSITIFFERRALFLENALLRCFDVTPLTQQPIQLILAFVDLYKVRQWRDEEREPPLSTLLRCFDVTPLQQITSRLILEFADFDKVRKWWYEELQIKRYGKVGG